MHVAILIRKAWNFMHRLHMAAVTVQITFCAVVRLISDEAGTAGWITLPIPVAVCFAGSIVVGEHVFFDLRAELVSTRRDLWDTLGCRQVTHIISYNNTFVASLYIPKQNVISYLKPKEENHVKFGEVLLGADRLHT
jgi:hypothetical protein